MIQLVSHWPLNMEVPVQSQATPQWICSSQSLTGIEYFFFFISVVFTVSVTFHQHLTVVHQSITDANNLSN